MNKYAYEDTRDVSYIKNIVIRYNEEKKNTEIKCAVLAENLKDLLLARFI